jgi:hypothetical protein
MDPREHTHVSSRVNCGVEQLQKHARPTQDVDEILRACVCVLVYAYTYVLVYLSLVCIYVYTMCVRICVCVCVRVYVHACVVCVCVCVRVSNPYLSNFSPRLHATHRTDAMKCAQAEDRKCEDNLEHSVPATIYRQWVPVTVVVSLCACEQLQTRSLTNTRYQINVSPMASIRSRSQAGGSTQP